MKVILFDNFELQNQKNYFFQQIIMITKRQGEPLRGSILLGNMSQSSILQFYVEIYDRVWNLLNRIIDYAVDSKKTNCQVIDPEILQGSQLQKFVRKHIDLRAATTGTLTTALPALFNVLNRNITFLRTHSERCPQDHKQKTLIQLSIDAQPSFNFDASRDELQTMGIVLTVSSPIVVPWFPRNKGDLDSIGKTLIELDHSMDHAQFQDKEYRIRRNKIADISKGYKMGQVITDVDYTPAEHDLWRLLYNKLSPLHLQSMSERFLKYKEELEREVNISQRIPQLRELSGYLEQRSGFVIKPVHGILNQRQFLNALAFKVFCSTQYLRHVSNPEYTPEPDIVHEFLGHVPTFADPEIAKITQNIGLLSLGASDQEISKLSALYWFTLEFGVCKEHGQLKAFGAGIAGCVQEIEYFLGRRELKPRMQVFDMNKDCWESYPLQSVQPVYKVTQSFQEAIKNLSRYGSIIMKPITTIFNQATQTISYDRNIEGVQTEPKVLPF